MSHLWEFHLEIRHVTRPSKPGLGGSAQTYDELQSIFHNTRCFQEKRKLYTKYKRSRNSPGQRKWRQNVGVETRQLQMERGLMPAFVRYLLSMCATRWRIAPLNSTFSLSTGNHRDLPASLLSRPGSWAPSTLACTTRSAPEIRWAAQELPVCRIRCSHWKRQTRPGLHRSTAEREEKLSLDGRRLSGRRRTRRTGPGGWGEEQLKRGNYFLSRSTPPAFLAARPRPPEAPFPRGFVLLFRVGNSSLLHSLIRSKGAIVMLAVIVLAALLL